MVLVGLGVLVGGGGGDPPQAESNNVTNIINGMNRRISFLSIVISGCNNVSRSYVLSYVA
jgi:hypothetical protein